MTLRSALATLSLCFVMASANADSVKLAFDSLASSDTYGQVTLDLPFDIDIEAAQFKKVLEIFRGAPQQSCSGDQ